MQRNLHDTYAVPQRWKIRVCAGFKAPRLTFAMT